MKRLIAKIWIPALLVLLAAAQSSGIGTGRSAGLLRLADSLTLSKVRDSLAISDSLKDKDPFFYKYYIAVKDSAIRVQVRDSLLKSGDSLELHKFDSLYIKDSTEIAKAKFDEWYASLSRRERKKYDIEQALPGLIAAAQRKTAVRDSIRARRDSIIAATPRVLETFAVPDSMQYKRIITWKHDRDFHNMINLREQWQDTSYNNNFHDFPFLKTDVNAVWLGVAGSPVEYFNFFKRSLNEDAKYFTPYEPWSFTTETLPMYNTKTPYTELAYWGTLFANQEKEEANIKILTTQNITPELNLTLQYTKFGGNGILKREDIDYRTFVVASNYIGKKYMMHAGYIYNRIEKSENGGVIDLAMIRDTTIDAREVEVYLKDASSRMRTNTVFLDQSYRIPLDFITDLKGRKERKREKAVRDSIMASGDTVAIAVLKAKEEAELAQAKAKKDSLSSDPDITTAFIGHSSEFAVFRRSYYDKISESDKDGREFYNNVFYLNPTQSKDSMRVMRIDNKVFVRLQPWKQDAIVSRLDVGIGDKVLNFYNFKPSDYLSGPQNVVQNSVYLYASVNGQYKKYFNWDAKGNYTFLGHEINDFGINANIYFNFYPFRRDRQSPLTLKAHFETGLKEPNFYDQHLYTNHFRWDNDFGKISTTKAGAALTIPRWDMSAAFDYALLNNNIYYDTLGIVRQNSKPMSIMSAYLRKDFRIWKFHLDNRLLFQLSSNQDVVPLPLLALNLRYYIEFDVVKNAMQMQIGANGTFTTKWHLPAYNPAVGVFHNQDSRLYGNCPYIDVFVNIQWKRVSIFVKALNINMGWPSKSADYFSADGYINTQRAFKVGISWPFWVFPSKKGGTGGHGHDSGLPGGNRRTTN